MSENKDSIAERFRDAVSLIDTNPEDAVVKLEEIQSVVRNVDLFSSNETLDEVTTPSLSLLALDYHLAMSFVAIPTREAKKRKGNLLSAMNYFARFLEMLDQLEILPEQEKKDFLLLSQTNLEDVSSFPSMMANRDEKIMRLRSKQDLQMQLNQLRSIQERRKRLGLTEDEVVDGYDDDTLTRNLTIKTLIINAAEATEEWKHAIRELPMIEMQLKIEQQQTDSDPRKMMSQRQEFDSTLPTNQGMLLTHITKDTTTGQISIRKEEIRSQVFRPGWNQPTMSLEELAQREVNEAMERKERQEMAEEDQKKAPRRYDQLVKDGMEDNADLVDASAALDRAWDDWRAENPRGSGNKMGDRGDRNF
jgi:immunoglobulin-binding protein 1